MELSTKQENRDNEKIKALSAEIVVHGKIEKPYYEIKYYDLSDGKYHIGYSSYDLNNVFGWLEECFEIVKENKHDRFGEQARELREIADCYYGEISSYAGVIEQAADTIEALSAKLAKANMERSSRHCKTEEILQKLEKESICPYPFNRRFIYLDIASKIVKSANMEQSGADCGGG